MFLFSPSGSFPAHTCLWVFQVSDIIADTVFCLIIIPIADRFETLSDIWEIRLKDATEQSENNPWQRLGKVQQCHKFLPERQYNRNCFHVLFAHKCRISLKNSMSLYLYVLAFGSHFGEGLGSKSIKHESLTILIYDTPTIFWFRRTHVKHASNIEKKAAPFLMRLIILMWFFRITYLDAASR